ncbi:hypothetical protein Tco_1519989 [Tanacetum coccineum]
MPTSTLSLNPSFVNNTSRTTKPIIISSFKTKPIPSNLKFRYKKPNLRIVSCSSNNMNFVKDDGDEEGSGPPLQVESEVSSKPRRIALFVEPSPFA